VTNKLLRNACFPLYICALQLTLHAHNVVVVVDVDDDDVNADDDDQEWSDNVLRGQVDIPKQRLPRGEDRVKHYSPGRSIRTAHDER